MKSKLSNHQTLITTPSQNDPGLFVTGTGVIDANIIGGYDDAKGFLYFRTDYNLNNLDFVSLDEVNGSHFYAGGNLHYDVNTDDIYVSGTITTAGDNAFFFDMIQDVSTTPLINSFSLDPLNWNGQIGVKTLPASTVDGYPKSGWIAATASDGNRVAGRVCINTGAGTVSLPVIMTTTFNATDFSNWTTAQSTAIYYYPRTLNTIAPVQFYLGQSHNQIWHPNHSSIEYLSGGNPTEEFGLTGLNNTTGGPKAVLNFIDISYDNDCNYQSDHLGLDLWPVIAVGVVDVIVGTPGQTVTTPYYNTPTVTIPSHLFCTNVPFKSEVNSDNQIAVFEYNLKSDNNKIIMNCDTGDAYLQILNIYGEIVLNSKINNSLIDLDVNHFQPGIYLLKVSDSCNLNKVIKKFVIR